MTSPMEPFPAWALQPRRETGAAAFVTKRPEADGRGVIIAVLDSGVDPAAGGLQVTSEGKPKIIDRLDGSGAGDVDTSTVVEAVDGQLTGATGRTLRLPTGWTNPSGKWHVGQKAAMDLYPRGWGTSRAGLLQERQEKYWEQGHKEAQAAALRKQQELEAAEVEELSLGQKLAKENAEAEVELVAALDKKAREAAIGHWLTDVGPVYDCLVWHDGSGWRAAIDTSEAGDLAAGLCLGVYRETREFGKLSELCQVNVSINVWDDGNLLEIVSMPSSHGTHVASIAAANFPEAPEKNGLAPGAQIVSINIGDSRLSSMETGTALVRAMSHIMRAEHYKVDVINMSYGEHSHWSSSGRVGELMGEVINKHGVVWVASAGNDGPALSTVGTPPDIATSAVIGVGAYVSPEMMTAMYSNREKLPGTPFTWTSRGPTIDGDRGVTVCAPGGAITSVPQFTMRGTQLMNGTSMASPHVAGALGLLLSGLRGQGLAWSPYSVKRALANTAVALEDTCKFGQGHGLLNIEAAFEHLTANADLPSRDVHFAVTCGGGSDKGVHLRGVEAGRRQEVAIKVEPIFLDADHRAAADKQGFNRQFAMTCSSAWVSHPTHLDLMYCSRHFLVQVDPTGLPPGAHAAYISAYDTARPGAGKVWEVAITVIRTETLAAEPRPRAAHTHVFQPGTIRRHFLPVPHAATWATFTATNKTAAAGKFVLHTVQLLASRSVRTLEHHKMFSLGERGDWSYSLPVRGGEGQVVEVCLAKWWANLGTLEAEYTVTFHGLLPSPSQLVMHGGEGLYRVDLETGDHPEDALAEVKLKSVVQSVRPTEARVVSLKAGERDTLPPGRRTFELQLTYTFSLPKAAETVLALHQLADVLYESELESQLWMVYDGNKRLLACGDAYPQKWAVKLDKGEYTVRAHVRHEKRELVERFQDTSLSVSSKLSSAITLEVYASAGQAMVGGKKAGSLLVAPGKPTPLWVAPIAGSDKHSKGATLGQYLAGTATFAKDEMGKKVDVYPFKYILPEGSKKKDKSKDKEGKKKAEDAAAYEEALRDCKISWLAKLGDKDLYTELVDSGGEPAILTSIHAAKLANLLAGEVAERRWGEVAEQAEVVVRSVDQPALLAWLGMKTDTRENAAEVKKEMEKVKGQLVEALAALGEGLLEGGETDSERLLTVYTDILKYTEVTDSKVFGFMWKLFRARGLHAKALKLAVKAMEEKPTKEGEAIVQGLAEQLGWQHVVRVLESGRPARFPADYQPF